MSLADPPDKTLRPIDQLLAIMAQLRNPDGGCPWDVEQDFVSIAPYTIEEAYEVADAIARKDMVDLKDELGDLLLQVVFHARMAEEQALFDFDAVADAIVEKMVRRHPHVFSTGDATTPDAVKRTWEEIKAEERRTKMVAKGQDPGQRENVLDGVAIALPALTRAEKLSKRAASVGFTWETPQQVFHDLEEEVHELTAEMDAGGDPDRLEDEMGDILFVVANLARMLNIDPEKALHRTNRKFMLRFNEMERKVNASEQNLNALSISELDRIWNSVKGIENK